MTIGDKINNYLKDRNMNARELAKKSGVTTSYVYAIVANEVTNPTIRVVNKLGRALNLDKTQLGDLVDGEA